MFWTGYVLGVITVLIIIGAILSKKPNDRTGGYF